MVDGDDRGERNAAARGTAAGARVDDPARVLSTPARAALENAIRQVEASEGDRLWVTFRRDVEPRALGAKAATLYASWGLAPEPPRATVLVVIDVAHRRAALETGQGVEGPLTNLEADRLIASCAPLLEAGDWEGAAVQLVRAVSSTAAATRARRRPPAPDIEPSPEQPGMTNNEGAFKGEWGWFSRLAGGVAAFFLLLVAVRQRRRAQEREDARPPPPAKKYLGPPRIDR